MRRHPLSCKTCGKGRAEGLQVSARGYCPEHGDERATANNAQIRTHSGPFFEHWRRRTLAAFGGVPLDDLERDG